MTDTDDQTAAICFGCGAPIAYPGAHCDWCDDEQDYPWWALASAAVDFVGMLVALAGCIGLMLVFAAWLGKL